MVVGVDGRRLLAEGRGITRYTRELLTALARANPDDEYRVLVPELGGAAAARGGEGEAVDDGAVGGEGVAGGAAASVATLPNVRLLGSRWGRRAVFAAAAVAGRPRLERMLGEPVDVVWLPQPAPVAVGRAAPYVLTLHDLSFEVRPGDFTAYERLWQRAARARPLARGAARVMAVSEATRQEAIDRWGLAPERVVAVPSGVAPPAPVDPAAVERVRRARGIDGPYVLYVGALEPRKGTDVLARACREAGVEAHLVVAGHGRSGRALDEVGARLLGRVGDQELAALYAGAVALVLPSHLEGFGFTPLEALAHGTPAVVSDLPALRETLGEAAVFVPPGDARALAAGLRRVTEEAALRERLVAAGRERLEELTWERAAERARAVLAEAAG